MSPYGPPFWDVRIEMPRPTRWLEVIGLPGLMAIDLYPPAAGPEVELTLGTAEGVEAADEDFVRAEVERVSGSPVLAIRQKGSTIRVGEAP